ncbi:MAG: hypothetical protein ACI4HI_18785 [Lachnospiraceae bacterium]
MRMKPVVVSEYHSTYLDVEVDLKLDCNLCFVIGDSGEGKSFLWQILDDDSTVTDYLLTFNYHDINKNIAESVREARNKLIVIDNADLLLDDPVFRRYLAFDERNQYILFGRDTQSLFLTKENFKKVAFKDKTLSFENVFQR